MGFGRAERHLSPSEGEQRLAVGKHGLRFVRFPGIQQCREFMRSAAWSGKPHPAENYGEREQCRRPDAPSPQPPLPRTCDEDGVHRG